MELVYDLLSPQRTTVRQMRQDQSCLEVYHRPKSQSANSCHAYECAIRRAKCLFENRERLSTTRRDVRRVKANTPTGTISVERTTEIEEHHTAHSLHCWQFRYRCGSQLYDLCEAT